MTQARTMLGCFLLVTATLAMMTDPQHSPVDSDQRVVLFPTTAWQDDEARWHIPVHAWLFEPEEDSVSRAMLLGVLRRKFDLPKEAEETALFKQRLRAFLVDNKRGRPLVIASGQARTRLDKTTPGGHGRGELIATQDELLLVEAQDGADNEVRWAALRVALPDGDPRTFVGLAQLPARHGVCVVSDIDDTIKLTEIGDRKAVLRRTFLEPFVAVPGMAEVYRRWASDGASFHYVSASPWQLYEPLQQMLVDEEFPPGSLHLQAFRVKDSSFLDLFKNPNEHKRREIQALMARYPERSFVLVGDSGQVDPEIYGQLAREHPEQIAAIYIRHVTEEDQPERYAAAFAELPTERWRVFRQAAELQEAPLPQPR